MKAAGAGTSDHDLSDVVASRKRQNLLDKILRRQSGRRGAKALGEPQGLVDPPLLLAIGYLPLGVTYVHGEPLRFKSSSHPPGSTHDRLGMVIATKTDK